MTEVNKRKRVYQSYVDILSINSVDEGINLMSYIVTADSPEDALEKTKQKAISEYPDANLYFWEITDDDILEDEDPDEWEDK